MNAYTHTEETSLMAGLWSAVSKEGVCPSPHRFFPIPTPSSNMEEYSKIPKNHNLSAEIVMVATVVKN